MSAPDEQHDAGGEERLIAERRAKLDELRAAGTDPFPYEFPERTAVADVLDRHAGLTDGEETTDTVRLAGRLTARRGHGKAAFLDLTDRSGRIQLHARKDVLGDSYKQLVGLDLGDVVGIEGAPFRTRRGELSVRVDAWTLLAKSLRPPPDKYHGLADVEQRYRHRELDLIANEDARALFMLRSRLITAIRGFLDEKSSVRNEPGVSGMEGPAPAVQRPGIFRRQPRSACSEKATGRYCRR